MHACMYTHTCIHGMYIFTQVYHFWRSSFFPEYLALVWYHFLRPEEQPSLSYRSAGNRFSPFPVLWNVFTSSSLWGIVLLATECLLTVSPSSTTSKSFRHLLALLLLMTLGCHLDQCPPLMPHFLRPLWHFAFTFMFEKFGLDMAGYSFLWLPCLSFAEFLGFVSWCFFTKSESQGLLKFLESHDTYFRLHSVSVALLPTIPSLVSCILFLKYDAQVHAPLLPLLGFLLEMTFLPTLYHILLSH